MIERVHNGPKLQEKQIIQFSKSKLAAVCYGQNYQLKYLIISNRSPHIFAFSKNMLVSAHVRLHWIRINPNISKR